LSAPEFPCAICLSRGTNLAKLVANRAAGAENAESCLKLGKKVIREPKSEAIHFLAAAKGRRILRRGGLSSGARSARPVGLRDDGLGDGHLIRMARACRGHHVLFALALQGVDWLGQNPPMKAQNPGGYWTEVLRQQPTESAPFHGSAHGPPPSSAPRACYRIFSGKEPAQRGT